MNQQALVLLVAATVGCGDNRHEMTADAAGDVDAAEPDAAIDSPLAETSCSSSISTTGGEYNELCALAAGSSVHHVTIANLSAPATHASAQIFFGFASAPTSAQGPIEADQFKLMLYGGGPPGVPAMIQATFGAQSELIGDDVSFVNGTSTVCFDLHDGSATTSPTFVLWVDGKNGASCADASTLTIASAFGVRTLWHGAIGAIDNTTKIYFRQAAGVTATPTITLAEDAVLDEAAARAATTCATSYANDAAWGALCTPAAGARSHVRVQGITASATSSYWYAIFGETAAPTGNPTVGAGKLIVTGGNHYNGTSATYFRFDGDVTTAVFPYATDSGDALYIDAASDICFDLGSTSTGGLRIALWATGAHAADCANPASLTTTNVLFDSSTDATSASWDAPLGTTNAFVKTSNANASLGAITVRSEAAAL